MTSRERIGTAQYTDDLGEVGVEEIGDVDIIRACGMVGQGNPLGLSVWRWRYGGDQREMFAVARGLMDDGHDPVLVTRVPPGPSRVLNYFQRTDFWGHGLSAERGFAGILENQPLDGENHFTIDKDPDLHREVLDLLESLRLRSVSARLRPAGSRPARMPVPPRPPVRAAR